MTTWQYQADIIDHSKLDSFDVRFGLQICAYLLSHPHFFLIEPNFIGP
jgi:hypothetical protein